MDTRRHHRGRWHLCSRLRQRLTVAVGSHSGLGVFDARTGRRLLRYGDEDYGWYRDEPPTILIPSTAGGLEIPAAGIWGGALPLATADGWTCTPTPEGAVLSADEQTEVTVRDPEELRACGFSPDGRVFIFATSPTLTILARH